MANSQSQSSQVQSSQPGADQKKDGARPIWLPAVAVLFIALVGMTYALDMTSHHDAVVSEGAETSSH